MYAHIANLLTNYQQFLLNMYFLRHTLKYVMHNELYSRDTISLWARVLEGVPEQESGGLSGRIHLKSPQIVLFHGLSLVLFKFWFDLIVLNHIEILHCL